MGPARNVRPRKAKSIDEEDYVDGGSSDEDSADEAPPNSRRRQANRVPARKSRPRRAKSIDEEDYADDTPSEIDEAPSGSRRRQGPARKLRPRYTSFIDDDDAEEAPTPASFMVTSSSDESDEAEEAPTPAPFTDGASYDEGEETSTPAPAPVADPASGDSGYASATPPPGPVADPASGDSGYASATPPPYAAAQTTTATVTEVEDDDDEGVSFGTVDPRPPPKLRITTIPTPALKLRELPEYKPPPPLPKITSPIPRVRRKYETSQPSPLGPTPPSTSQPPPSPRPAPASLPSPPSPRPAPASLPPPPPSPRPAPASLPSPPSPRPAPSRMQSPPSPRPASATLPTIREALQDDPRPGTEQSQEVPNEEPSGQLTLSKPPELPERSPFRPPGIPASASPRRKPRLTPAINSEPDRFSRAGTPMPWDETEHIEDISSPGSRSSPLEEGEVEGEDEYDEDEDEPPIPNLIPDTSPSDTREARLVRQILPFLTPGSPQQHGAATYGDVPRDRQIELFGEDSVHPLWGILNNTEERAAQGSTNGFYLQDRNELIGLWKEIRLRKLDFDEVFRGFVEIQKEVEDEKVDAVNRFLRLAQESIIDTEYMDETWGGPVTDFETGRVVDDVATYQRGRHPSGARSLTPQYKNMSPTRDNKEKRVRSVGCASDWLRKVVLENETRKSQSPQEPRNESGVADSQDDAKESVRKKPKLTLHGPRKPDQDDDTKMYEELGLSKEDIGKQKEAMRAYEKGKQALSTSSQTGPVIQAEALKQTVALAKAASGLTESEIEDQKLSLFGYELTKEVRPQAGQGSGVSTAGEQRIADFDKYMSGILSRLGSKDSMIDQATQGLTASEIEDQKLALIAQELIKQAKSQPL